MFVSVGGGGGRATDIICITGKLFCRCITSRVTANVETRRKTSSGGNYESSIDGPMWPIRAGIQHILPARFLPRPT